MQANFTSVLITNHTNELNLECEMLLILVCFSRSSGKVYNYEDLNALEWQKMLWVRYADTTCEEGLQHVKHFT